MEPQYLVLPWGKETLSVNLPENWRIAGVLDPSTLPPVEDTAAVTLNSLTEPLGCPRLGVLFQPGMRVALVVDDGSRPTPVARMLPALLQEMKSAGMRWSDLTVVAAIGLHRPMTAEEISTRMGLPDMDGLAWENPEVDNPEKLSLLGVTSRGTPVWICKTVAEADLVISVGCIEPHIIASFGGGYKNIVPGCAGRLTIAHNHSLNCTPATFNMVGQPIEANPMRLDLEEAAGMLKGRVFVINAVLNHASQTVAVVAGHPLEAHRAGARISAGQYGVEIPRQADVVISDSSPMDQDLRQGVKALANTIRAVKKGGSLITLVRAEEGVGVFGLANSKLPFGRRALQLLAPLLVRLIPHLKVRGLGEEDRFFLYFAIQAMCLSNLIMVAPTIPVEIQSHLPFVRFVENLDQAIALANRRGQAGVEVLVFPHGGITYPKLPQN
jgi:lactate racemase